MKYKNSNKSRISRVCNSCRIQKLKCDRERPSCKRCLKNKRPCYYDTSSPVLILNSVNIPLGNDRLIEMTSKDFPTISNEKSKSTTSENYSIFQSHDLNLNYNVSLWNARDMYVSQGPSTYLDFPYGPHSIAQYDPFSRIFCSCTHGTVLADLQNKLDRISLSNNITTMDSNTDSINPGEIISPLQFLKEAITHWAKNTNRNITNQLPPEYFNTIYTIEDRINPKLMSTIQELIQKVELLLPNMQNISIILLYFYENVYPFYPLIEIPTFENNLKEILEFQTNGYYKIIINKEDIRRKIETLVLFLLIIVISLRDPKFGLDNDQTMHPIQLANNIMIISEKLLSLLNGFKFTSENALACLLYSYISEYLNPGNDEMHVTHNGILILKCLTELAITLGLHEEPSQFSRYKADTFSTHSYFRLRYKLWLGIQTLRMLMITADGGCTILDQLYLENYFSNRDDLLDFPFGYMMSMSEFEKKLFELQKDKYQVHIKLTRLMNHCNKSSRTQNLIEISENINNLGAFISQKFPLPDASQPILATNIFVEEWRGAKFKFEEIKMVETLKVNILYLSSVLSIYNTLMFHFERNITENEERNEKFYHFYLVKGFGCYLELLTLILQYFENEFSPYTKINYEYSLNKGITFLMIKLWIAQLSYILRFSRKNEILINQLADSRYSEIHSKLENERAIVSYMIDSISSHMGLICILITAKFGYCYIGCSQVILMINYFLYLVNNSYLGQIQNAYWTNVINHTQISTKIVDKMNLKWGLSASNTNFIEKY
ncbi:hypothetical protein TBLA_0B04800 [Henningerozyma blattae CBS 6284]|uniref:Zn(2)-C6 fungal-type domain-containing protein n=1 Tax=Henningerozyma blattae (strain ATCC 34711 / CBS 6284 / DSM 70876 / NBRC 10599 / NRRL Y-10934 / UCD 77-7) TaxID=1071380 RepID=I2GYW2_HENB6|nr:hypothetical protein TBLA_0B04800 [Tetrapisispora blattae CBS 6284]CCH59314.1 hypothetical protein TBLA_0B04800 [Tetrapisispora blattae CBS 6284]